MLNLNPGKAQRVFTLGQIPLKNVTEVADLGLTYTNKPSFNTYIDARVRKAKARCNYVLRAFLSTEPKFLYKVFTIYIRPILEYATEVWNPTNIKYIKKVESVQKSFTYRIFNRTSLPYLNYENRLRVLRTRSLKARRDVTNLVTLHKIAYKKIGISGNDLFDFSLLRGRSRRHKFSIRPYLPRNDTFRSSFLIRPIKRWNALPAKVVESESQTLFKRYINKLS